jgi:hypothetical protein
MTPGALCRIGERLYGPHWREPLARALDVDTRTIRRWLSGATPIPKSVALAIMALESDA